MRCDIRVPCTEIMETQSPYGEPKRYSPGMRDAARTRSSSRPLAVVRRAMRWQPRSYLQIWALAAACYLVCPVIVTLVAGWPRAGGVAFVTAALGWSGLGPCRAAA